MEYRDIGEVSSGFIIDDDSDITSVFVDTESKTQVYLATHDEEGNRLPHYDRAFISFSYGERYIEDFGLVVVTSSDRLNQQLYANFEDLTTSYNVNDGQFYWGSHFEANQKDFTLATDGMTEAQLNDFRQWFKPGTIRKLILSETPNRSIYARVSAPPVFSLLPFEHLISNKIGGITYNTKAGLYKGEITLSFVMDDPFWVAEQSYLSGDLTNVDTLKIIYEDNIPHISMLQQTCFLGNNLYCEYNGSSNPPVVTIDPIETVLADNERVGNLMLNAGNRKYFYYSGTANGKPTIKFTFTPTTSGISYHAPIVFPYNSYGPKYALNANNEHFLSSLPNYNTITLTTPDETTYFYFTAPSICMDYNFAYVLVTSANTGDSAVEIKQQLVENLTNYYFRAWAVMSMDILINNGIGVDSVTSEINNDDNYFAKCAIALFKHCFSEHDPSDTDDGASVIYQPMSVSFNTKTGESTVEYKCRVTDDIKDLITGTNWNGVKARLISFVASDVTKKLRFTVQENAGNMVRSDYLTIKGRNTPNSNGIINNYRCSTITFTDYFVNGVGSNYYPQLDKFVIEYKNLYL